FSNSLPVAMGRSMKEVSKVTSGGLGSSLPKLDEIQNVTEELGKLSAREISGKISEFRKLSPKDRLAFLRNFDQLERRIEGRFAVVLGRRVELTNDVCFGVKEAIAEDRNLHSEKRILQEELSTIHEVQENILKDRRLKDLVGKACEQLLAEA